MVAANRRFRNSDDGVSPIVAVILMVAITVVLSTTVWILAAGIGSSSAKSAPAVGWDDDDADFQISVVSAPPETPWSTFEIRFDDTSSGLKFALNDIAAAGLSISGQSVALAPEDFPEDLVGGDALAFCSLTGTDSIVVSIVHAPSGTVVHRHLFENVPPDATCS